MIRNLYWFSYNVPVIIVPQIFKNTQISNFMKIRPVVAELFHMDRWAEGRTERRIDTTKLIVAFRNFANAPRKELLLTPDKYSNFSEYGFSLYSDGKQNLCPFFVFFFFWGIVFHSGQSTMYSYFRKPSNSNCCFFIVI
jgi:hypothetical protein